ncbi:cysteine desulfurase [Candidatus Saccharibacteria bacterium]|nr:cysteine desulfurase [Candidatus Saccharibacteria bacterium]
MKKIYLDYAAATPIDKQVLKSMEPFFSRQFYNPSALYLAGREVRQALEDARALVAQNLGARPAEITFTAGATEANNLALRGIMQNYPDAEVLVSAVEHDSVLAPAELFNSRRIPVDKSGRVILDELEKMISDKTALVSVGLVNNEIGTIQSLHEIAKILKAVKYARTSNGPSKSEALPLLLHTDAAQAPSYFDLHVSRLGVDLLTINSGKIYGPKQSGALYARAGIKLKPLILGGGQEDGLRSGTENVAGAVGLATAFDLAQNSRSLETRRLAELRRYFVDGIQTNMPLAVVNGSPKHSAPHIISVTFPGIDNERLMMELDERGIQTATGSACNASSDKPSHVLEAIGLSDKQARSSLRFSFGRGVSENDINHTLKTLTQLLKN